MTCVKLHLPGGVLTPDMVVHLDKLGKHMLLCVLTKGGGSCA